MSRDQGMPRPARVPVSTYRLQFAAGFTFRDARAVLPYLRELGITDIYASPYFKTGAGSSSGYDIVDPNSLNPELGTEEDYAALVGELKALGMGQILDVVPNHLCIACGGNAWWQDVLENGLSSPYAAFFDIDWRPFGKSAEPKVLIPILATQFGDALEGQELQLTLAGGGFAVLYQGQPFPLAPETYPLVLDPRREVPDDQRPGSDAAAAELAALIAAFGDLPPRAATDAEKAGERRRHAGALKKRLAALLEADPGTAALVAGNVRLINGAKGDHASFDRLEDLVDRQAWRLSYWRVANEEINYRRFFDLNHLAAIRVEDRRVFDGVHGLVFRLIEEGAVTGLRIDHMDGLADPAGYLRSLQDECRARRPQAAPFYIVVEKILTGTESLPEDWPVQGTTGYDFLNAANGLFVKAENARLFETVYRRFADAGDLFADVAYRAKKLVMQVAMAGEVRSLAVRLKDIADGNRHTRDFTLNSLARAVVETIACFPVYRTYVTAGGVAESDWRSIGHALAEARRRNPATSRSIFDFLEHVLRLDPPPAAGEDGSTERLAFIRRFQQLTGPVMAKGLEDTAFYVETRLVSLNEVGGGSNLFGLPVEAFHARNAARLRDWPHGLNATSTHDTKRSEDVRARIDVLSEMPRAWRERLARWRRLNLKRRRTVDGRPAPDGNEEYLIYQTLLGAWPLVPEGASAGGEFAGRIKDYFLKAMREAKVHTSWIDQNRDYEEAVLSFISEILDEAPGNRFLKDFVPFQAAAAELGLFNSLSQTLLKIASPGVPDFYQGTEIWDFSLVDPDNRRPVDHAKRKELLDGLGRLEARLSAIEAARELVAQRTDGRIKLFVTSRALRYRRDHREIFESGAYVPLAGEGPRTGNLCAFARTQGARAVLAVAPRFLTEVVPGPGAPPLGESAWKDGFLHLPPGFEGFSYRNIFTGEVVVPARKEGTALVALAAVFAEFPVALLETVDGSG